MLSQYLCICFPFVNVATWSALCHSIVQKIQTRLSRQCDSSYIIAFFVCTPSYKVRSLSIVSGFHPLCFIFLLIFFRYLMRPSSVHTFHRTISLFSFQYVLNLLCIPLLSHSFFYFYSHANIQSSLFLSTREKEMIIIVIKWFCFRDRCVSKVGGENLWRKRQWQWQSTPFLFPVSAIVSDVFVSFRLAAHGA